MLVKKTKPWWAVDGLEKSCRGAPRLDSKRAKETLVKVGYTQTNQYRNGDGESVLEMCLYFT